MAGSSNSIGNQILNNNFTIGDNNNNVGGATDLVFRKSRARVPAGAAVPAAVVQAGDFVGSISFQGYDGTNFFEGSGILNQIPLGSTVAAGQIPTTMFFGTSSEITSGSVVERLTIDKNGQLIVATPDTGSFVPLSISNKNDTNGINLIQTSADSTGGVIALEKNRSGGVITTGDSLGNIIFAGYDGTNYITSSQIKSVSSGTIAANRVASDLEFYTHPDSNTSSTQRMVIASTGAVTINAPDSGTGLTVSGGGATITSGDLSISNGNLNLHDAVAGGTTGVIKINTVRYICNFGTQNFFAGENSGNTTAGIGAANSGFGYHTLLALTTGFNNTAVGWSALAALQGGGNNVAIGLGALSNIVSGSANTCVGLNAGSNYTTTEINNICIGQSVSGTVGESSITRIGVQGTQAKCFIAGIRGVTTDAADAIAVLISSTGQLGTVSSSIRFKENIQDMGSTDVLNLRPVTFNFKSDESKSLQYGLIAEEVKEIMPRLVVYNQDGEVESVKYHELPVLLLNEIQKLNARIKILEEKLGV